MSKHKVLLLGPLPPPYIGPAIATEILLKSGLSRTFQVFHMNTRIHTEVATLGAWDFNKIPKSLLLYFRFCCLIIKSKPDLVLIPISQTTVGFWKDSIFIIISRLFRRKTLLQLRGSNFQNWIKSSNSIIRGYVLGILKSTQGMVILGANLKYLFRDYYAEDRLFVVPNGVNLSIESHVSANNQFIILYLSNIGSSKGIEDVLRALEVLENRVSTPVHLDVVGDWRDELTRERVTAFLANKELPLTFHGPAWGNSRFDFYAGADLFVFPPREPEGHPWVIVEAMAAGLPIIATDHGAITESVLDGVNGFIVETGNPGQIAEKIRFLIENPGVRKKMGQESRRLYLKNFTEDKMVERLSAAFKAVLAE